MPLPLQMVLQTSKRSSDLGIGSLGSRSYCPEASCSRLFIQNQRLRFGMDLDLLFQHTCLRMKKLSPDM